MKSIRTLLYDADTLAYRFGTRGVVDVDFGDGDEAVLAEPAAAVLAAKEHVGEVYEECGADAIILCWSDPVAHGNFRFGVDCTYKWKRGHSDRPANYYAVREAMSAAFTCVEKPGLEADDVMGIMQTAPAGSNVRNRVLHGGETIIVSVDKDMLQIPGLHYNPVTKRRTTVEAIDGDHLHMLQTIMGDAVDNYAGIPGVGIKGAEKYLAPAGLDPVLEWECVVRAYIENLGVLQEWHEAQHVNYADAVATAAAITTARLSKILQWEDYDTKAKEVKLWLPPPTQCN